VTIVADEYERSGEFLDLMMAPPWTQYGPAVAEALAGVPAHAGPVVDVGAGGGLGTMVIGRTMPTVEIVAVEPSTALRSVLLSRMNGDAGLRERVTVLAERFLEAGIPTRLGAVVAMNVIGHFPPPERRAVWGLLAERLGPGARAVLNLLPPHEAVAVPEFRAAQAHLGRRRYEAWGRAEPAGADSVTWRMTYRVFHEEELVHEVEVSYAWWVLTEWRLRDELGEHGLRLAPTGPAELAMYLVTAA